MSSASVIIHKQNKIISLFNEIGAIDAEHAVSTDTLGIRRSFVFNRMVLRRVFIECEPGKFYIDNNEVPRFKEQRRNRALIVCAILLLITGLYYLFEGRF